MGYTFTIKMNIYMYNHLLVVSDKQYRYEAIVESAPMKKGTIIIWLEDFGFPMEDIEIVKTEMKKWFNMQNITCIFNEGKGR